MNAKVTTSIFIGTILLFIWNALSWMALPFHTNSLNNLPEASINQEFMVNHLQEDGVYHYPGLPEDSEKDLSTIEEKLKTGPRITLLVYKSGPSTLFDIGQFIRSLLINLFTVLVSLLLISKNEEKSLKSILIQSILFGILIGIVADLGQMNWYLFPLDYTLINILDRIIPFTLLGLLFGGFTFREKALSDMSTQ